MSSEFSLPCEEEVCAAAVARDNAEGIPSAFSSLTTTGSIYNISHIHDMSHRVNMTSIQYHGMWGAERNYESSV